LNGLTQQLHFQFGDMSSKYLGHGSAARSWVLGHGHSSEKTVVHNLITASWKLLGLDQNICYDNARRDDDKSELLTF